MRINRKITVAALASAATVLAGPVYTTPGANLTDGDATHGQRVQSASSNPVAAAADLARASEKSTRDAALSVAAGLEHGNVQNLFEFYDEVTGAYEPSDPGVGGDSGDDGGINIGDILDLLDPECREARDAFAKEVVTQTALPALIKEEGRGKRATVKPEFQVTCHSCLAANILVVPGHSARTGPAVRKRSAS